MPFRLPRPDWAWLLAVLAALLAIYLPGLFNQPVFDDAYLVDGRLLADYATPFEMHARWLSYGSFVWLQSLLGDGWIGQRAFNLLVHVGVVLSLWALYRELLRSIRLDDADAERWSGPAIVVAVGFFALNPVAVYAVAYLIQRSILMATLFVVLGLWSLARALRTHRPWLYVAALACYVLAVASKEHAVLAPIAAVPVYVLVARPGGRKLVIRMAAGAVLVGIAGALLWQRFGNIIGAPFDEFSRVYLAQLGKLDPDAPRRAFPLSIVNQAYLFFEYGLRWALPASGWMSINLRPPFPVNFASFPQVLGAIAYPLVVVGSATLLWRYRDWRALAGVAILIPALLFATEFLTVWVQDPFVLYRSYLWAIGVPGVLLCVLLGSGPRTLAAVGIAAAVVLGWQALDRVLSISSPEAAWTDAIAKLSNDPRAVGRWFPYLNRGAEYMQRDEYALALRDFENSQALGDMGLGALNSGTIYGAQGEHRKALAMYDEAQRQGYQMYNLPFQRGLSLLALGEVAAAHAQFVAARDMAPPSPTRELVLQNLGRTALQMNRVDEAIATLEELLRLEPGNREGRYLLAMALLERNQPERAREMLTRLLDESATAPAYYGRAIANYALKRKAEALADIQSAIQRDPRNPQLHQWMGRIRALPDS